MYGPAIFLAVVGLVFRAHPRTRCFGKPFSRNGLGILVLGCVLSAVCSFATTATTGSGTATPQPKLALGEINQQLLADQQKLGNSYDKQTRTTLTAIAGRLLLQLPNLPPKTTPQEWGRSQISSSFAGASKDVATGMVFWVMTEAVKGATGDLHELISQKTLADGRQRQIADLLARTRQRIAHMGGAPTARTHSAGTGTTLAIAYTRNMHLRYRLVPEPRLAINDINTASVSHLHELEDDLNTVGDDAQLANVELQDALQKQQETIQMLSSIEKMVYDTALGVIRKIGG